MSTLSKLSKHSKFLQPIFEGGNINKNEEQSIINTFPIQFRDKINLALHFINKNSIPKDQKELKLLVELLHFLDIDKIKDIYKIVFNSSFYNELNNDLKLDIEKYLNLLYKIACGRSHSVAIREDGSIITWGLIFNDINLPTEGKFIKIACGECHSVALKEDGSIVCWGEVTYNQLIGCPTEGKFIEIACGRFHSVALKEDGSIVCWGKDVDNQLHSPKEAKFIKIASRYYNSVAIRQDGSIVSWGKDVDNQLF